MGRGPRLHAHFFGRLRAAQGNGAVFRMGGYGRHRRQWVNIQVNSDLLIPVVLFSQRNTLLNLLNILIFIDFGCVPEGCACFSPVTVYGFSVSAYSRGFSDFFW